MAVRVFILLLLTCGIASAQPYVGTYPNASTLSGTERLLGTQGLQTVNVTPAQLASYVSQNVTSFNFAAITMLGAAPVLTQTAGSGSWGPLTIQGANLSSGGGTSFAPYAGVQLLGGTTQTQRGGNVFLTGGQQNSTGGQETGGIELQSGSCYGVTYTSCNIGDMKFLTPNTTNGEQHGINFTIGNGTVGGGPDSYSFTFIAGSTSASGSVGGGFSVTAGSSTTSGAGGPVSLEAGEAAGSSANGSVVLFGANGGGSTTTGFVEMADYSGNNDFLFNFADGGIEIANAGTAPTGGDLGAGTLNVATKVGVAGAAITANALTFPNAATTISLAQAASGSGGTLTISGANGPASSSGSGGVVTINAGNGENSSSGTSAGGALNLNAGNGGSSTAGQNGGALGMTAGTGGSAGTTANGGSVSIAGGAGGAGASSSANGGSVTLLGGAGGHSTLNPTGGNITLTPGSGAGSGTNGVVVLGGGGFLIASLPACGSTAPEGSIAYVTNGVTSPTYLGTVSTTGSTVAPVFCNGSSWVYY